MSKTVRAGAAALGFLLSAGAVMARDGSEDLQPRSRGWYLSSYGDVTVPPAPRRDETELAEVKALTAKRRGEDIRRSQWWAAGGPAYRWNEIATDEFTRAFVTLPLAMRNLALLHTAIDDAVAAATVHHRPAGRRSPAERDPSIKPTVPATVHPAAAAAAAVVAAEVLAHLMPERASVFAAHRDDAITSILNGGHAFPSEVEAGRAIGRQIAALAITRANTDGSSAKWSGTVPDAADKWRGANPVAPAAVTWKPWVLARVDEFRPAAPPAPDSGETKTALAELKSLVRTARTNHRAAFWEVNGGARAHTLWNEIARTALLERENWMPIQTSSRVLAVLNVALIDAAIACWDAKYAYWHPRPSQLDSELKTVVAPPNHPSYPSAHGCFGAAASTVLARVFPEQRERIHQLGMEAGEARLWAGIHYRYDVEAGRAIGEAVALRALERGFVMSSP